MKIEKQIVVIADRVLISPDEEKSRTGSGLYLPQGLSEKERVQSGFVVKTGPGYILPYRDSSDPWLDRNNEPVYIPLQVRPGDYAIFLRKDAVEIEYNDKVYLIVAHSAILAVIRDKLKTDIDDGDEI
ncbi:MAG TPA: co-chaperone GroES [bacterium]|nr:co-chaperone GroES [bacterium]